MSTKRNDLTAEEASHPSVTCWDCNGKHTEEHPLVCVSVKTPYEDDFHYECKRSCPAFDD